MKYFVVLAIALGIFYVTATQLIMTQVNQLGNFYSHADAIAQTAANEK